MGTLLFVVSGFCLGLLSSRMMRLYRFFDNDTAWLGILALVVGVGLVTSLAVLSG